ncbi:MAG: hypothetical protein ACJ8J0_21420 [Longimicrobiaceae bacterium]
MGLWSSIKRAVKRAVKAVVSAVVEIVSRVIRIVTTVLTYLGILDLKTLRLRVLILRRSNGSPLATPAEVLPVVERAKEILRGSARIRLVPTSGDFVLTINEFGPDVPEQALHLRGAGAVILDQLGVAGEFFDDMIAKYHSAATFPFNFPTTPITCFIVEDIDGGLSGIAMPVFGNWFAIRASRLAPTPVPGPDPGAVVFSSIMAHELGHCMGLFFHRDDPANLMFAPDERGVNLTQGQLVIARSARCVSVF